VVSILSSYEQAPAGYRRLYIRAYQIDREKLPQLQKDLKAKATMLYMVDHREDKREI
jgi:acetoin utilization protein AcuB